MYSRHSLSGSVLSQALSWEESPDKSPTLMPADALTNNTLDCSVSTLGLSQTSYPICSIHAVWNQRKQYILPDTLRGSQGDPS